jgi:hypothetical protein
MKASLSNIDHKQECDLNELEAEDETKKGSDYDKVLGEV